MEPPKYLTMTKPQGIIIQTKIINGTKIWVWNNRAYASEYLARLAAIRAGKYLERSIAK